MIYYTLMGKTLIPASALRWAEQYEDPTVDWRVAFIEFGDVQVSTVFLGIDHNWGSNNHPILFETMVFGGHSDQYQRRYATWEEAEKGHNIIVDMVKSAIKDIDTSELRKSDERLLRRIDG